MPPRALSVVAKSGTGKTTLLERLVPELGRRGVRVAVVKHDAHRFDIDHPGKDSHRLFAAGAEAILLLSPEKIALVKRVPATPDIRTAIATWLPDVDLVLTEGFKQGPLPKIELHRKARSDTLLCRGAARDPTLVAVASDTPLELDVPVLPLDDVAAIADFVQQWMASGDGDP